MAESALMKSLMDKARLYASTNAGILINGNSGTGKELLAQSIHNASPRHNQPFVAVNCAAIPASLLESELFGYEEGAFSGAKKEERADCSNWPIKVPSFWMKSIPCPLNCRVFCCVPFRRKKFEE